MKAPLYKAGDKVRIARYIQSSLAMDNLGKTTVIVKYGGCLTSCGGIGHYYETELCGRFHGIYESELELVGCNPNSKIIVKKI